ncbi:DUF1211 domain-containing protein [Aquabacter sp. L1I39]|uniref:TMEM175 family protein n=1 Tax=Aquabacter sp. L1I39 TaxID=2820278 RepID=UPI001ADBA918|nr:TMEM175 family protein [Aquabacter sp. L1I39]QTL01783.1 DUF1211 domain-containing protein [Aquabacter sp. L1I39]
MSRFSRPRLESLTDGIFAFAMTVLVLDIRLPADLPLSSAADLTAHLIGLWPQTITYVISFFVLGAHWRGIAELRPGAQPATSGQVHLQMIYLFFVTLVPFSSSLVGKYGSLPPAVIFYAGNMIALGLLSIALRYKDFPPHERRGFWRVAGPHMPVFIASAAMSALLSLVAPDYAMLAYLLNIITRFPRQTGLVPPGTAG